MPEYINRPPRIQPELPSGEREIPAPPNREQGGALALIQLAVPLIAIMGYVFVSGRGGGGSILFVLPMALSVLATSAVGVLQFIRTIRIDREKQRAYAQLLMDLRNEMIVSHDQQRAFYRHNYPDMDAVIRMTNTADGSVDSRMWERRPDDNDFGAVRLGIGALQSTVIYKKPQGGGDNAPLLPEAQKLSDDSLIVRDVPITIPLRPRIPENDGSDGVTLGVKIPAIGRYAIGICGSERKQVSNFVRSMFVNFTAFHAPTETRLFVIGSSDARADWDWARWMPHCNTTRETGQGDQLAFEPKKARRVWDMLQNELERRQLRSQDENAGDVTLPFLVVVVDALTHDAKDSPRDAVSTEATISILLAAGPQLGAAVVFLVPERDLIPSECRAIIQAETVEGVLSFRYAEIGLNTMRYDGDADVIEQKRAEQEYSRKLAAKIVRATFGSDVATSVNLLELFSVLLEKTYDKPSLFPLLDWWRESRKADKSEWMRVPIGLMAGNKVRSILFAADGDGVHGLVAGTTGSGKSELLLTIVVGLAMRYDPSVVNFVLADYKGGTAFDPFKPLPHAVDIVSNLQGLAGARTFVATKAEMNRRSALLAATNTKHIVHYRQKDLHETREPFPFLFIIVDEFAEMVKENPEFKGNLDSITRLGRALGITLILATQRPGGVVTDQMRSNMKWKICLRVESSEDSRELLKRSDAAFLPNNIPGRGYIQVGNDNIELMQVARAGAPYTGATDIAEPAVIWRYRGTSSIDMNEAQKGPAAEAPAISDLLVALMAQLALENPEEVKPQKKPWPDPLPAILTLDQERLPRDVEPNPLLPLNAAIIDWMEGEGRWHGVDWSERAMRANIGLIDNPIRAEQLTLQIDFTKGPAVVFGMSGSGKTIMLRTIATALAATHSPKELHIYIMDFAGKGLDVLTELPHLATCVLPAEDDRVQALLRRLTDELEQRKGLLAHARVDNILQYNIEHPDKIVPAMLVLIDNFADFKENYENLLPELMGAVRDGRSCGIYFVFASQQISALPTKLYNMISTRMTFRLPDHADYATVVGRVAAQLPDIGGRGFIQYEGEPLEMQVALPVGLTQEDEVAGLDYTKKLAKLIDIMKKEWGDGPRPQSVDLVRVLSLMDLFSHLYKTNYTSVMQFPILDWWRDSRKAENSQWMKAPLGLIMGNKVRSLVFAADADGSHGLVAGTTGSGKSELLLTLVAGVAMRYDPSVVNFILADYKGGAAFDPFRGLPHAVDIVSNLQGLAGVRTFVAMRAEMNRRSRLLADSQTKHIVEYRKKNLHETREPFPFLFVIVDEFAEMIKENPELRGNLDSITRLGRALGMMLILATQRPAGVVNDQMRSNMKWRVCLRVETGEDSRELLKRDDAAFIANNIPGRGYLQVGNDPIELMQVARAGGPYTGPMPDYVTPEDTGVTAPNEPPALSNLLTKMMEYFQKTNPDIVPQQKPYPDPLPVRMTMYQDKLETDVFDNPLMPLEPILSEWLGHRNEWPGVNWSKDAMHVKVGLIDDPGRARNLPLELNFNKGHVAVFGGSGWGKTVMMRSVVMGLAAKHSPSELHVYFLDFGGKGLDVLTDLPHVSSSILPGEDDRVQAFLRRMNDELENRKNILSQARVDSIALYNAQNAQKPVPAILVVIDNFSEFRENYENLIPDLQAVVRDARACGIYFIVTAQLTNVMPAKLYNMFSERMTFRLTDTGDYANVLGRNAFPLPEIPGRGYLSVENEPLEYQVALSVGATPEEKAAGMDDTKKLAALATKMKKVWGERPRPQSVDLVRALSLMELFSYLDKTEYTDVNQFPILDWWAESRKPENSQWMKAPVGLITGNKVRSLVFAADADGSHGLVAGTTGSGKSELLLTVVAGLALRYDPSVVNFILADYKGGAAFDPFRGLPHAVDIVSNLQGQAGARTFTAMKAEMNRRSALLAQTQTKHIVEYRKKNLHMTREPFPFLFIIVDEFAEMVKENPEFKGSLDSITRLGRALGLTLILATQRPAGVVTDQMRSNMKWRICLRVETAEDSRELIKRNDAAYLPNSIPGRAFLQVGNENVELMQVARAGGPYNGPLPDYLPEDGMGATSPGEVPALSNLLTKMMEHFQKVDPETIVPQKKPYPDPLPERVTLSQERLLTDVKPNPLLPLNPAITEWLEGNGAWHGVDWAHHALRAPVGLVDNPIRAEQLTLNLNLMRGHLAIFGMSGYGKTMALRTIVMTLASTHSPAEMHVYALDFGGRGLDVLLNLPHCGATIQSNEEERVLRLLRMLTSELERRKNLLSQEKFENVFAYNAAHSASPLPSILVLIDNFAEFKESYEAQLGELLTIVREARPNGIHFIVTADLTSSIPAKLYAQFTDRWALRVADIGEYGNIVGRGVLGMPDTPGRGYVEIDRMPLEMHLAITVSATPEEIEQGLDDPKKLAQLVETMRKAWGKNPLPKTIDVLRPIIPLKTILPEKPSQKIAAVIGIEDANLQPAAFDLAVRGPHFAIMGPPLSGKTTTARAWVLSLAWQYNPSRLMIILVDFRRRFFRYGGERSLDELPHVVATVSDQQEFMAAAANIKNEFEITNRDPKKFPRPEIFFIIDNYDDLGSAMGTGGIGSRVNPYKDISEITSKYGPEGFHAIIAGSTSMTRSGDEFIRKVMESRYALGLDAGETASALGGRIRGAGAAEFPPGRGYIVRSGRVALMQVAMPHEEEELEASLDVWVKEICDKYPKARAEWTTVKMERAGITPEVPAPPAALAPAPTASVATPAAAPGAAATTPAAAPVETPPVPTADDFTKRMAERQAARRKQMEEMLNKLPAGVPEEETNGTAGATETSGSSEASTTNGSSEAEPAKTDKGATD